MLLLHVAQTLAPNQPTLHDDSGALIVKFPEIILIPLVGLVIVTLLRGSTGKTQFEDAEYVGVGIDLCILAMGFRLYLCQQHADR